MEDCNSEAWSTIALLGSDSESNEENHQRSETKMQPSPSLSQLMKRRRRRCGGVFRTVEPSSSDFAVEYDWPYRSSTITHTPNLSIDTSKANEAFFQRSSVEVSRFSSSSGSTSPMLEMGSSGRKYSFERDTENVSIMLPAARNLATSGEVSTRSPSVYSQKSGVSALKDPKEVDLRLSKLISAANKPAKPVEWPARSSSLAMPKLRSRSGSNFNSSDASKIAPIQDLKSVIPEVKLTRASSTTFQSIRRVSSKLEARTRSFTKVITEKVTDLKLREARPRRAAEGQRDVSKEGGRSSEVGSGNHALGRNARHGPEAVRSFFSSGKHSQGRRRVY